MSTPTQGTLDKKMIAVGKVDHGEVKFKCQNCGDDTDVIQSRDYVGGQGYVWSMQCRDRMACWARRDRQMGLDCGMDDLIRQRDENELLRHETGHCDG